MTLEHYPPASAVLAAHVAHLVEQAPTVRRYIDAAVTADQLAEKAPERSGCTAEQRDELVQQYLAVLDRQDWCTTIRSDFDPDSDAYFWFAGNVAMRLQLRAFTDPTVDR
ncbi:hypothetical protein AB0B71_21490 [Micromonospora echinofusca]|uniref:hypothetical protein n=1 Tax=Micromonospora echinofusca TaxID=47858 RepID=UPI0033F3D722